MVPIALIMLGMTLMGAQLAHAAPAPKAPTTSHCVVHIINLHGSQPATSACAKWSTSANIITPDTSENRCSSYSGVRLEIDSNNTGAYCFTGSGYLGLGPSDIYDVVDIASLDYGTCGTGWVMWYDPPSPTGTKFYFACLGYYDHTNSVFDGTIKVTQVYLD